MMITDGQADGQTCDSASVRLMTSDKNICTVDPEAAEY